MACPQKEKEKDAALKGKPEQNAVKAKDIDKATERATVSMEPDVRDKFLDQEILRESFKGAVKDVLSEGFTR